MSKQLTVKQLEQLVLTMDDDLLVVFPKGKFGLTRAELRRLKKAEVKVTGVDPIPVEVQVEVDAKAKVEQRKRKSTDKKYQHILDEVERLKAEKKAILALKEPVKPFKIEAKLSDKSEATAFLIASDWHFEEVVKPQSVSQLNEFNEEIANQRAKMFFQNGLILYNLMRKDIDINTIVLALLGDFISGNIHDDLMESNRLEPMEAILEVQRVIVSGIDFLLDNSNSQLVIPCHSGNHPRITKKRRVSTEAGNSLEYFMYCNLADRYADNSRVTIIPSRGYHSYPDVYDMTIRFHHGHAIRYAGGVGGITIPVNKAIAQWNKARRADLDVFGHYHQHKDLGEWVCNGSLIGYNAFALSIKADYESPRQAFFLVDKMRGKTITAPILLNGH